MRQRIFLPAQGWLENFFLLLKFTCQSPERHWKCPLAHLMTSGGHWWAYNGQNVLGSPIMKQRTFLPVQGWLENLFLLLKFTCLKHRETLEVPTSIFEDLRKPLVGIKWPKHPGKPNHEAENFFAYPGLVGELFSVAQIHMSRAQRDIGSAHKHL